jgi:hypothetical protein
VNQHIITLRSTLKLSITQKIVLITNLSLTTNQKIIGSTFPKRFGIYLSILMTVAASFSPVPACYPPIVAASRSSVAKAPSRLHQSSRFRPLLDVTTLQLVLAALVLLCPTGGWAQDANNGIRKDAATGANAISAYNFNNLVFVDGVKYPTLSGAAADPACSSSNGCTIDMRGNSSTAALALGSFDPGAKTISVLLGPYTYTASQISLQSGLHISGTNSGVGPGGQAATTIQSGSPDIPIFVLAGTAPVLGISLEHMRLYCSAGNKAQIGMQIVAQSSSGLWYSQMNDILIGGDGKHECAGGGIVLDGNLGGYYYGVNQFIHFSDIYVFRARGGGPALKISGMAAQLQFDHCQFDGPDPHDSDMVNVLINDGTETIIPPNTIVFNDTTFQHAWGPRGVAVQIHGCANCVIDTGHFEDDNGGVELAMGTHYGNFGDVVRNSLFTTNTGQNHGHGFITRTDVNSELAFDNNNVYGTPDTMHAGNTTYLSHQGTMNGFAGRPYPSPYSSFRAIVGYDSDGPAFKHLRIATGELPPGRSNVSVKWTTPFADSNYSVNCIAVDSQNASTSGGLTVERVNAPPTSAGITVTINNQGKTASGSIDCQAWHD